MAKSESTKVSLGRIALGYVGIIFIILAPYHVLSTLLRFSLGNSVDVFFSFD